METKQLPAPERDQHREPMQHSPYITLVFIGIAATWVIVLIIGIGINKGAWAAWWSVVSIGVITVIVVGVHIGHEKYKRYQLHRQDIKDREHHRAMTHLAILNDHSAEHISATSSFRAVSKYMGPAGSITIKDNMLGQQQQHLASGLPTAPAFSHIIEQVRPSHMFLGQGMLDEIWGDVTDLLSTINIGRPGTGKSTLLRGITGQLLEIGGKPLLFDPHGSILDDLGTSFECAESPREIVDSSRWLERTLEQRLLQRRAGHKTFQPLLLMADEMPVIAKQAPQALR